MASPSKKLYIALCKARKAHLKECALLSKQLGFEVPCGRLGALWEPVGDYTIDFKACVPQSFRDSYWAFENADDATGMTRGGNRKRRKRNALERKRRAQAEIEEQKEGVPA